MKLFYQFAGPIVTKFRQGGKENFAEFFHFPEKVWFLLPVSPGAA
jgi:hypothetical protein